MACRPEGNTALLDAAFKQLSLYDQHRIVELYVDRLFVGKLPRCEVLVLKIVHGVGKLREGVKVRALVQGHPVAPLPFSRRNKTAWQRAVCSSGGTSQGT